MIVKLILLYYEHNIEVSEKELLERKTAEVTLIFSCELSSLYYF